MIIEKLTDRELAIIYAHLLYRNTELENYHSRDVRMDSEFYEVMKKVVSKNIRMVKRNQKILASVRNIGDLERLRTALSPLRGLEFVKYAMSMESYALILPGSNWDPAETIDAQKPKNVADFILEGRFKECCDNHAELDDDTMRYINQDVHNRIYTLVRMEYFD